MINDKCPEPITIKKEDKEYWIMAFEGIKSMINTVINDLTETKDDVLLKNPHFGLQLNIHDTDEYNILVTIEKNEQMND